MTGMLFQRSLMMSQNVNSTSSEYLLFPEHMVALLSLAEETLCENTGSDKSKSFDCESRNRWNKRKTRTVLSAAQLNKLEIIFEKEKYPIRKMREHLATTLKLSITQVNRWFENRRVKSKSKSKRQQELSIEFNSKAARGRLSRRGRRAGARDCKHSSGDYTPLLPMLIT